MRMLALAPTIAVVGLLMAAMSACGIETGAPGGGPRKSEAHASP